MATSNYSGDSMETNTHVSLNSQEESKPTKTQMNALSVDQAILDIFTVLAIASKQKRISSVEDLINRLKEKQNDVCITDRETPRGFRVCLSFY